MNVNHDDLLFNGRDISKSPLTQQEISILQDDSVQTMQTESKIRMITISFIVPLLIMVSLSGSWTELALAMVISIAAYSAGVYGAGWVLRKRSYHKLGCSPKIYDPFNQYLFSPLRDTKWSESYSAQAKAYLTKLGETGRKPLMLDRYIAIALSDTESYPS